MLWAAERCIPRLLVSLHGSFFFLLVTAFVVVVFFLVENAAIVREPVIVVVKIFLSEIVVFLHGAAQPLEVEY